MKTVSKYEYAQRVGISRRTLGAWLNVRYYGVHSEIIVERPCLPPAPFYVRWINQHGGYDHFMFSRRQTYNAKLSKVSTAELVFMDNENALKHPLLLSATVENSVTVGATNLEEWEINVLNGLLCSTCIEHYDTKREIWIPLTITGGKTKFDTRETRHGIELELTMPEQVMQV